MKDIAFTHHEKLSLNKCINQYCTLPNLSPLKSEFFLPVINYPPRICRVKIGGKISWWPEFQVEYQTQFGIPIWITDLNSNSKLNCWSIGRVYCDREQFENSFGLKCDLYTTRTPSLPNGGKITLSNLSHWIPWGTNAIIGNQFRIWLRVSTWC